MSYQRQTTWSTVGPPQGSSVQLIVGGSLYDGYGDHGEERGSGKLSPFKKTVSSTQWQTTSSWASGGGTANGILASNEKETMQNLNNRLSSYLDKVKELEEANTELEAKIREWHAKRVPKVKRDYSAFEKTIADLQSQIVLGRLNNARLNLQMDNAKLAVDDFTTKYDKEKAVRLSLEADVERVRKLLDNMTIVKTDLEMEVEGLRKELICMRKRHEEEMSELQSKQRSSNVNVELNATPSTDLAKMLREVREEYEAIIEKYKQEAENWYREQASSLHQEVSVNTEVLQGVNKDVLDLRRTYQDLQIELQAEISRKLGLEQTLEKTRCNISEELQRKQERICQLEAELSSLRDELSRQQTEHRILMDIKIRLENEIATYRRLLDGDGSSTSFSQSNHRDGGSGRRVRTIVKDFINGQVVSSKVSEIHQKA